MYIKQHLIRSFLLPSNRNGLVRYAATAAGNQPASNPPPTFDAMKSAIYEKISQNHRHENGPWNKITESAGVFLSDLLKANVLDLATGPGEPAITIAKKFPHVNVMATDISPDQVNIAKKLSSGIENMDVAQANMEDLSQFESNYFDVVTCSLGYMFPPDIPKAVSETYRVLKPGGHMISATWNNVSLMDIQKSVLEKVLKPDEIPESPVNPLSLSEPGYFEGILQKGGFESIQTAPYTYPFDFGNDPEFTFQACFMLHTEFLKEKGMLEKTRSAFDNEKENWGSFDENNNYIIPGSEYKLTIAKKPL